MRQFRNAISDVYIAKPEIAQFYLQPPYSNGVWPNCNLTIVTTDRKAKIEIYFSKEIISFLIYLGIYFLADNGI